MSAPEKHGIEKTHSVDNENSRPQCNPTWQSVESFVEHHVADPEKRRNVKMILISSKRVAAVHFIKYIRRQLWALFKTTVPVDAVWAEWGEASENPELPQKLTESGIGFVGPSSHALALMGNKVGIPIIAQSVQIPTIEWSGSGLVLYPVADRNKDGVISVSDELFAKACVSDATEGLAAMEKHKIGYPLMIGFSFLSQIKASEGGGGKGIRKVANEKEFNAMFAAVQAEVPGAPIFIMKCVENARRIEVQLIADRYGNTVPVRIREYSIHRRRQKIIEEAPASIAPSSVLQSMQEDAVRMANGVGCESAVTVEYMHLPEQNKYFFFELNPRFRVEQSYRERTFNINFPGLQWLVAMGVPLPRIASIGLCGLSGAEIYSNSPLPAHRLFKVTSGHLNPPKPDLVDLTEEEDNDVQIISPHEFYQDWKVTNPAEFGVVKEAEIVDNSAVVQSPVYIDVSDDEEDDEPPKKKSAL